MDLGLFSPTIYYLTPTLPALFRVMCTRWVNRRVLGDGVKRQGKFEARYKASPTCFIAGYKQIGLESTLMELAQDESPGGLLYLPHIRQGVRYIS